MIKDAAPGTTGIGEMLRAGRESRGFSHTQISQRTRLRKSVLEALENEDWDRLPQPVFVRGFIRSYATALGMDPEPILALYPGESAPIVSPPIPRGFGEPLFKKTKPLLIAVGLACAAVTGYGVYKHGGAYVASLFHSKEIPSWGQFSNTAQVAPEPPQPSSTAVTGPSEPLSGSAPEGPAEGGAPPPAAHSSSSEGTAPGPTPILPAASPLILRASVLERTWVSITVDDQAPKEYIFSAGSHPRWEAQNHFHLVIGNAGGMKLNLNGASVGDLGDSGQVIRLRLP